MVMTRHLLTTSSPPWTGGHALDNKSVKMPSQEIYFAPYHWSGSCVHTKWGVVYALRRQDVILEALEPFDLLLPDILLCT